MIIIGDRVMVVYRGVERLGTVISTHPVDYAIEVRLDGVDNLTVYPKASQVVLKVAV